MWYSSSSLSILLRAQYLIDLREDLQKRNQTYNLVYALLQQTKPCELPLHATDVNYVLCSRALYVRI